MTVTSGAPGSPRRRTSGSKTIRQSEARFSFLIALRRPFPNGEIQEQSELMRILGGDWFTGGHVTNNDY